MGAAAHLGIKPGEYDKLIATLIPHYRELIDAAAAAVDIVARTAPAVVDLGTGSGALRSASCRVRPKARLIGIDADAAMLARGDAAPARQDPDDRGQLRAGPHSALRRRLGVVRAAPHPDRTPQGARSTSAASQSLRPGGMFVSADCYLASSARAAAARIAKRGSITCSAPTRARKAENFLQTWAKEDVYFTLDREIELLRNAGFGWK